MSKESKIHSMARNSTIWTMSRTVKVFFYLEPLRKSRITRGFSYFSSFFHELLFHKGGGRGEHREKFKGFGPSNEEPKIWSRFRCSWTWKFCGHKMK